MNAGIMKFRLPFVIQFLQYFTIGYAIRSKLFIYQKIAYPESSVFLLSTDPQRYLSFHRITHWLVEYLTVVLVENQSGETMIFD
jgi:hypothetical protein